jgi:tRNA A-37 threonylcarbamoyl transferase component Bud32
MSVLTLPRSTKPAVIVSKNIPTAASSCTSSGEGHTHHHATRVLLAMILEAGFFHADPHPGNVFVEPGGRIALIDFGMIGQVDTATQAY